MKYLDKFKKRGLAFLMISGMILSGCQVTVYDDPPAPNPCNGGAPGYDGRSYLALEYYEIAPDYIWGDNPAIPSTFYYGDFYESSPGVFNLYYEGAFQDGCCLVEYYYDVEYTLWYHPGEPGGPCGRTGADGPDAFLTIWMDPEGAAFDRINKKSDKEIKVLEDSGDVKRIEVSDENYTLQIKYTKLQESRKAELSSDGELSGERK